MTFPRTPWRQDRVDIPAGERQVVYAEREKARASQYDPVKLLTNSSGATVLAGSVISISDALTVNNSFTTSTTQDNVNSAGVTLEDIPNNRRGRCLLYSGLAEKVRVAAGTTRGQYLRQSTTAGVGVGTATQTQGSFAQALTTRDANGYCEAVLIPIPSGPITAAYNIATANLDVTNTLAETSIYSFTLTGGDLGTNRSIIVTITGYDDNGGVAHTIRIRVKYGVTTLIDTGTSPSVPASPTALRSYKFVIELMAKGATNSQVVNAVLLMASDNSATTGRGDEELLSTLRSVYTGESAINTAVNQTLDVTIQLSVASLSILFRREFARAELR